MKILRTIQRNGIADFVNKIINLTKRKSGWFEWRFRNELKYKNPTFDELNQIERDIRSLGIDIIDYEPSSAAFKLFQAEKFFPSDYHGGESGGVWDEKLLEHFISSERLSLMNFSSDDIYVDAAAGGSPWAQVLREKKGIQAYAINLTEEGESYRSLPYYRVEDAASTKFPSASVKGISLHCAYEMFTGDDDMKLIREAARFLIPGGKMIIIPLYMHTHYCAYASPEYFGKGYSPPEAKEYIRLDCMGIPSSRKYDAIMLKRRVLDIVINERMKYKILALRNKHEFGKDIYCHFILEICK